MSWSETSVCKSWYHWSWLDAPECLISVFFLWGQAADNWWWWCFSESSINCLVLEATQFNSQKDRVWDKAAVLSGEKIKLAGQRTFSPQRYKNSYEGSSPAVSSSSFLLSCPAAGRTILRLPPHVCPPPANRQSCFNLHFNSDWAWNCS